MSAMGGIVDVGSGSPVLPSGRRGAKRDREGAGASAAERRLARIEAELDAQLAALEEARKRW